MEFANRNLGQLILNAARQAVALHLESGVEFSPRGQRVAIGRAGPQVIYGLGEKRAEITDLSRDGRLPAGGGRDGGDGAGEQSPADASPRPPGRQGCSAEGAD